MASFFSRLSPVPSFPDYTGPYKVGTLDVEIPTAQVPSPWSSPDPSISTVSFRVFYPCEQPSTPPQPVYWLPEPQREFFKAYLRFLGAGPRLSGLIQSVSPRALEFHTENANPTDSFHRYLPFYSLLSSIKIPALQNAKILHPNTTSKRWPVLIFAHGLGGSRNAYSHLLASLASHGVVAIAADHRDGSAPLSIIRNIDGSRSKVVEYIPLPHVHSPVVEDGRDKQMRIRLCELGTIYEALLKIDRGENLTNIAAQQPAEANLSMFTSMLDVHTPSRVSWSGHSFGAATMVQLFKSVFYRTEASSASSYNLFGPLKSSSITRQITPESHLSLLDLWCGPLRSRKTSWLWDRPLPCYSPSSPGGSNLVAVLSESFFKWRANLDMTKRIVFPPSGKSDPSNARFAPPHVFHRLSSAHLSQSDFGLLSPWLTKTLLKADEPIRTLGLNARAILEVMRQGGIEVGPTSSSEMEEDVGINDTTVEHKEFSNGHDYQILAKDGCVKGWIAVEPHGQGKREDIGEGVNTKTSEKAHPAASVVEGELMKLTEGLEGNL
ncbi:hypothetical protein MMC31_007423 [Peltigera leucophlebia]|nr:hypothetical protein [Peltigera leucophlebia]